MTDEYKKIADKTDALSAELSRVNSLLSDQLKTKSGEICIDCLKKILTHINAISDEIRNL